MSHRMITAEAVAAEWRGWGRQLQTLRKAAGLTQEGLGSATSYGRSSIANMETAHQPIHRAACELFDNALKTGGALARDYDRIKGLEAQLETRTRAALAAQSVRAEVDSFAVTSHRFVPTFIGSSAAARFAAAHGAQPCADARFGCRTLSLPSIGAGAAAHVFRCGVVVAHVPEPRTFATVTELACWRKRTYPATLHAISTLLTNLLTEIHEPPAVADYVLSAYWITKASWPQRYIDTAVRLLSTPATLTSRDDAPTDAATEYGLLASGFDHPDLVAFGIPAVSIGYASWSGVAYLPHAPDRALQEAELVACEIAVQALWCYSNKILTDIEAGTEPRIDPAFGWRWLRSATSILSTPRPQETSQHRMMRDAILATSRLPDHLAAAQAALRD